MYFLKGPHRHLPEGGGCDAHLGRFERCLLLMCAIKSKITCIERDLSVVYFNTSWRVLSSLCVSVVVSLIMIVLERAVIL